MTAKVSLTAVSYGIGVQNRYSAFLDDEDGFILSPNIVKQRPENQSLNSIKQSKNTASANSATQNSAKANSQVGKTNGRQNGSSNSNNNIKHDQQKSLVDQQQKRTEGKRLRPNQQQGVNNNVQAPNKQAYNHRQVNNNQDNTANNNNNRFARSYSNHHHQSVVSQHQPNVSVNKENAEVSHHGKFARNNSQRGPNRRQFHTDDKKQNSPQDDGIPQTLSNNIVAQSSEEEKRRRQQKRALDMKHKDSEKREARRQQTHVVADQSTGADNDVEQAQGEVGSYPKGQRNRRQNNEGNKGQDETSRGFRGSARGRGRREDTDSTLERRDGQTASRGPRTTGDRQQRNRNGFGTGSRGSRGSRGEDANKYRQDSDRQKPIPNFSDKLDFPSLAS